jgi:hypothetical protein
MDATNESSPSLNDEANALMTGTKDGETAADHDEPYRFGRRPNAKAPYPFTERQYARLLIMRSRIQSAESAQDSAA